METDVESLRERLGRRKGTEEVVEDSDPFGLEVAIAVLDQFVDSVFESLNAIRLVADGLESNLVKMPGGVELRAAGDRRSFLTRR